MRRKTTMKGLFEGMLFTIAVAVIGNVFYTVPVMETVIFVVTIFGIADMVCNHQEKRI